MKETKETREIEKYLKRYFSKVKEGGQFMRVPANTVVIGGEFVYPPNMMQKEAILIERMASVENAFYYMDTNEPGLFSIASCSADEREGSIWVPIEKVITIRNRKNPERVLGIYIPKRHSLLLVESITVADAEEIISKLKIRKLGE